MSGVRYKSVAELKTHETMTNMNHNLAIQVNIVKIISQLTILFRGKTLFTYRQEFWKIGIVNQIILNENKQCNLNVPEHTGKNECEKKSEKSDKEKRHRIQYNCYMIVRSKVRAKSESLHCKCLNN